MFWSRIDPNCLVKEPFNDLPNQKLTSVSLHQLNSSAWWNTQQAAGNQNKPSADNNSCSASLLWFTLITRLFWEFHHRKVKLILINSPFLLTNHQVIYRKWSREKNPNITRAVRSSSAALTRTSCSGHERESRSRCRSICLLSRAEPGRSNPKHTRTFWLSSSRAVARSSLSRLHSGAELFAVGAPSDSGSNWVRREQPETLTCLGLSSPLAWQVNPGTTLLAMFRFSQSSWDKFVPVVFPSYKLNLKLEVTWLEH